MTNKELIEKSHLRCSLSKTMKGLSFLIIIAFTLLSCENTSQKTAKKQIQKTTENNLFYSKKTRDSIFENVIEITDNDVVKKGNEYQFNIHIPKSKETTNLFVSAKVPLKILSHIYPEIPRLIVIAPNWTYYDKVSDQDINCVEPMASSVIYEFNREGGSLQKDSLIIMGGFPKMKFKIEK